MSQKESKVTRFFVLEVLIPVESIERVRKEYTEENQTPALMVLAELENSLLHTNDGDIFVTNKGIKKHEKFMP